MKLKNQYIDEAFTFAEEDIDQEFEDNVKEISTYITMMEPVLYCLDIPEFEWKKYRRFQDLFFIENGQLKLVDRIHSYMIWAEKTKYSFDKKLEAYIWFVERANEYFQELKNEGAKIRLLKLPILHIRLNDVNQNNVDEVIKIDKFLKLVDTKKEESYRYNYFSALMIFLKNGNDLKSFSPFTQDKNNNQKSFRTELKDKTGIDLDDLIINEAFSFDDNDIDDIDDEFANSVSNTKNEVTYLKLLGDINSTGYYTLKDSFTVIEKNLYTEYDYLDVYSKEEAWKESLDAIVWYLENFVQYALSNKSIEKIALPFIKITYDAVSKEETTLIYKFFVKIAKILERIQKSSLVRIDGKIVLYFFGLSNPVFLEHYSLREKTNIDVVFNLQYKENILNEAFDFDSEEDSNIDSSFAKNVEDQKYFSYLFKGIPSVKSMDDVYDTQYYGFYPIDDITDFKIDSRIWNLNEAIPGYLWFLKKFVEKFKELKRIDKKLRGIAFPNTIFFVKPNEFNLIEKFCKEFNNIILDLKRSFVGVDLYFNLNVYDKEGNMIFDEDESTLKDTDFAERFKREGLYYQMKH